ncbi:hypothetical protein AKG34_14275 [Peribacillus butanolivorans]|uniref:hypothetical protein n=1 Tax=Peribacillus butanolivorans TaxID=421767 RepID=UPI0006A73FB4|nr:hypothetical protein [Peribacillus butanolivorans]KON69793.1 hypothetical protein AKG34_14275 [Peribacillus butanolivorans]
MDLLKDVLVEVAKTVANSTVVYLFSLLPAKKVKKKTTRSTSKQHGRPSRSVRFRSNRPLWIGY